MEAFRHAEEDTARLAAVIVCNLPVVKTTEFPDSLFQRPLEDDSQDRQIQQQIHWIHVDLPPASTGGLLSCFHAFTIEGVCRVVKLPTAFLWCKRQSCDGVQGELASTPFFRHFCSCDLDNICAATS